jgi:RHS repeat-associated protein
MFDAERDVTVYFELDAIGNVRRLRAGHRTDPSNTDPLPSDLGGYRYSAFGKLKAPDAATPAPALDGDPYQQPFRWQGRPYLDIAGGLYDFRARTWSPELGAFLQADKFEFLGPSTTLWSWPGQNPIRNRDTTGRFTLVSVNAASLSAGIGATLSAAAGISYLGLVLGDQIQVLDVPSPVEVGKQLVTVGWQIGGLVFAKVVEAGSHLARLAERAKPVPARRGRHECHAKGTLIGSCPGAGQFIEGPPASGTTEADACLAAKHALNGIVPRGCYARHVRCICGGR